MYDYSPIKIDHSFHDSQINDMFKLKDDLLKKIIQDVLHKEDVQPEDAKDFQIVKHIHKPGREFIGYKGNMIGEIIMFQREENNQWKVGFEFVPKTKMD